MSAASPAVETFQLVKQFGGFVAVDHINLHVNRGSFFGFLGPNGAGKSTTIKMLTGLLAPTSGKLSVLGLDIATQPMEVKRRIGVVPEDLHPVGAPDTRRVVVIPGTHLRSARRENRAALKGTARADGTPGRATKA